MDDYKLMEMRIDTIERKHLEIIKDLNFRVNEVENRIDSLHKEVERLLNELRII
jgi:uncharacterized small protein (DUF1192 family)